MCLFNFTRTIKERLWMETKKLRYSDVSQYSSKEVVCYVKSLIFRLFEIVHHKEVLKFTDQGQNNVQI